jgi:hypothetical protein
MIFKFLIKNLPINYKINKRINQYRVKEHKNNIKMILIKTIIINRLIISLQLNRLIDPINNLNKGLKIKINNNKIKKRMI